MYTSCFYRLLSFVTRKILIDDGLLFFGDGVSVDGVDRNRVFVFLVFASVQIHVVDRRSVNEFVLVLQIIIRNFRCGDKSGE